jgi:xeroderma pigmentosum group C-complementing protein
LEEVDLSNHLLKEPIPKKIDSFRGHPLYVLERHLRRNEVLRAGATRVGALTSGKGMNLKTENIFKRKDVIPCYSAREWFRKGRIVKACSSGARG